MVYDIHAYLQQSSLIRIKYHMYLYVWYYILFTSCQLLEITVSHWPFFDQFGRPKSILVGQIYCTFSMGWQLITYKMSYFQKTADQFLTLISITA